MKVEFIIKAVKRDLKSAGRFTEDDITEYIDRAHKQIVGASKWKWRQVEVKTTLPVAVGPATYGLVTLPLDDQDRVDVDSFLWVKDYDNGRDLYPVDDEPFRPSGQTARFYRLSEDGLELWGYPSTVSITDFRYKYFRKIYDLEKPEDVLLIPDEYKDVVINLTLSFALLGLDDARAETHGKLAGAGITRMVGIKHGKENSMKFIKPDPATQYVGSTSDGFDTSDHN